MTRFFTRLIARPATTTRPNLTASLQLESMESRISPSGLRISHAMKAITKAIHSHPHIHGAAVATTSLKDLLTLRR